MPDILGGSIGDLAKEIADEIDTDKLNLEDPGKLLKGLLSGNLENDDSGLMGLVENITGKIHQKVSSGELDQDKLFNEAQGVMSSFNKMGGGGNSNLFANLFSQMNQAQNNGDINLDLNSLQQSSNVKLDKSRIDNKINLQNTRNRLRRKLEEKKRMLNERLKEVNQPEMNEPSKNTKKRKKRRKRKKKSLEAPAE